MIYLYRDFLHKILIQFLIFSIFLVLNFSLGPFNINMFFVSYEQIPDVFSNYPFVRNCNYIMDIHVVFAPHEQIICVFSNYFFVSCYNHTLNTYWLLALMDRFYMTPQITLRQKTVITH